MKQIFIALAALAAISGPSQADPVSNAFLLCQAADSTDLLTKPCEVSGWGRTVTLTIDMNSGEARKLCQMFQSFSRDQGLGFQNEWTLEVKSPYSGGEPIAYCKLP